MDVLRVREFGRVKLNGADRALFEPARKNLAKFVTVHYGLDFVEIAAKDYIGNIPLHATLLLQVEPRFVGHQWDFLYLAERAEGAAIVPPGEVTAASLSTSKTRAKSTLDFIARRVVALVDEANRSGMLRRIEDRVEMFPQVRGKILYADTVIRCHSRSRFEQVVCEFPSFHADVAENQLIKASLFTLARLGGLPKNTRRDIRRCYAMFDGVTLPSRGALTGLVAEVRPESRLPTMKRFYAELLRLARMIVQGHTFAFEPTPTVTLEAFALHMSALFEKFLLNELNAALSDHDTEVYCPEDKGKSHPLFLTHAEPQITPDVVVKRGGVPKLVVDAKYINKPPGVDEFYQVIGYAVAYGCSTGMLVLPSVEDQAEVEYETANLKILVLHLNLNDPVTSCGRIVDRVKNVR